MLVRRERVCYVDAGGGEVLARFRCSCHVLQPNINPPGYMMIVRGQGEKERRGKTGR